VEEQGRATEAVHDARHETRPHDLRRPVSAFAARPAMHSAAAIAIEVYSFP